MRSWCSPILCAAIAWSACFALSALLGPYRFPLTTFMLPYAGPLLPLVIGDDDGPAFAVVWVGILVLSIVCMRYLMRESATTIVVLVMSMWCILGLFCLYRGW